jgi:uncharacterized hydrophobic protein (TIGR00341 family)
MALRIIEVVAPGVPGEEVLGHLDREKVLNVWQTELSDGGSSTRILLPSNETEEVTDLLASKLQHREGYRILLLDVEATYPRLEEPEEEKDDEEEEEGREEERIPDRLNREELYQALSEGGRVSRVYLVTTALATVVAAAGLIRGDVAVIIGAMVIAPLLGPNVALALASTLGDLELAGRAGKAIGWGAGLAFGLSLVIGILFPVDPTVPEVASRTRAGVGDLALALAAGSAGTLAYTTGLPAAVIGVMVAVALLPPLVVAGLMLGAGESALAVGAMVLVLTNVTAVNLAGVATFLAQKVRPRRWWEAERAKRATRIALGTWTAMVAILVVVMIRIYG